MGSLLSAVADDIAEYEWLCMKYDEEIQLTQDVYGNWSPDCYSTHAAELKHRHLVDIGVIKDETNS